MIINGPVCRLCYDIKYSMKTQLILDIVEVKDTIG